MKLDSGNYLGKTNRKFYADGLIISEIEYHQRVFEGWHHHANKHLTLILKGGNREQRKQGEVEAVPGTVVSYRSGELHRNLNTLHPSKNLNIEIEDTFFSNYSLNPAIFDDLAVESAAVKLSMLRVYRECISDDVYSCTVIHSMLLDLIVSHRREKRSGEHPKWVSTVKEIIHDRWNENISLKELSHLANVHPVTISKNFSKYFSCTLGEYLRRVKIEKSLYLISQTEQALTEIALQCGFADQSHFIRTFRAMTGFLPKHFRKL